jgi:hypothetical protein
MNRNPPSLTEARAELLALVYGQLLAWRRERLALAVKSQTEKQFAEAAPAKSAPANLRRDNFLDSLGGER